MKPTNDKNSNIKSYRHFFQDTSSADRYDEYVYAENSSASILWNVERKILLKHVRAFVAERSSIRYLDFACGTGRILSLLEDFAEDAVGVDIAPPMLERARRRVCKARLLCLDLTAPNVQFDEKFDLITSFRFLTNAEESLRERAVQELAHRLKDESSLLIINTHGNPFSYRLLFLPYHWLNDRLRGRPLFGYLSTRRAIRLLENAGLKVETVIGMGFVPAKLLPFLPQRFAAWIEHRLAGLPLVQRFGLNQMLFCRRKDM